VRLSVSASDSVSSERIAQEISSAARYLLNSISTNANLRISASASSSPSGSGTSSSNGSGSGSGSDALVAALDVFLRTADSSSLQAEARSVVPLQDQPALQDLSPEEIRKETSDVLGLSSAVYTTYTSLLDDLEVYRDQVRVQELDARISTARTEMNTALVLQLRQQRKALVSTTSELNAKISASSLAPRLEAAVKECTAFYMHLTDSDSFDVAFAQCCKRTMEYLNSFLTIMDDRLQVGQRLRERRAVVQHTYRLCSGPGFVRESRQSPVVAQRNRS